MYQHAPKYTSTSLQEVRQTRFSADIALSRIRFKLSLSKSRLKFKGEHCQHNSTDYIKGVSTGYLQFRRWMRQLEDVKVNIVLICKTVNQMWGFVCSRFYRARWHSTTLKHVVSTLKGSWLNPIDYYVKTNLIWNTHTHTHLSFILKVLSLSSDPEPRTLKAISSCLLSQFPVTAVILSLKKDGCSHNNLHGSYQTHHHCHCKKRKVFQSSDIYIFFPLCQVGVGYLQF